MDNSSATLPNWPSKTKKAAKLVPIYYFDTLCGVNFVPDEFVDITDEIDLKIQMLECHHSQLDWMREHDHIDFRSLPVRSPELSGFRPHAYYGLHRKISWAYGVLQDPDHRTEYVHWEEPPGCMHGSDG